MREASDLVQPAAPLGSLLPFARPVPSSDETDVFNASRASEADATRPVGMAGALFGGCT